MKLFISNIIIIFCYLVLIHCKFMCQEEKHRPLQLHDKSKLMKLQMTWTKTIYEDLTLRRGALRILMSRRHELSLSVPGPSSRTIYLESFPNKFSLVSRLAKTWLLLRATIYSNFGNSVKRFHLPFNVSSVYDSALRSLVRLQETYNLTTESLARGEVEGAYPHTAMTTASMMDVAIVYHRLGHPWRAEDWLLEALSRTESDYSIPRIKILEYLHIVTCYIGDLKSSNEIFARLIKDYPSIFINKELQNDYNNIASTRCTDIGLRLSNAFFDDITAPHYVLNQNNLCDPSLYKPPLLLDSRLRCRLVHYNKPHLRLAPFRVEEVNLDPPVLIFYNVLHDGEVETVKRVYHNKTRPAFYDSHDQTDRYFDTQFNTWLLNKTDPITRAIDQRAAAASNTDLHRSEHPMVASYGPGAEIKLHDDLIRDETYLLNDRRTRPDYVTYLFYLNDVAEGGYTIFPYLDLAVAPVKGAALMWHNRLPDWSRDTRTMHSGCPVLRGSKWIINKWFHVRGQYYPKCYHGGEKSRMYYYLPDTV